MLRYLCCVTLALVTMALGVSSNSLGNWQSAALMWMVSYTSLWLLLFPTKWPNFSRLVTIAVGAIAVFCIINSLWWHAFIFFGVANLFLYWHASQEGFRFYFQQPNR
ncbi:MAG: hypothetical protein ABH822_00585 [Patescibacteria group bacterium]